MDIDVRDATIKVERRIRIGEGEVRASADITFLTSSRDPDPSTLRRRTPAELRR